MSKNIVWYLLETSDKVILNLTVYNIFLFMMSKEKKKKINISSFYNL